MGFQPKQSILFTREWAMSSAWTFTIKPIDELLKRYVGDGTGWFDPFAGNTSPAEFTNDMNPERQAEFHMEAVDFCHQLPTLTNRETFKGILFDPPYSNRQIAEHYQGIGKSARALDTSANFYSRVKNAAAPLIEPGGLAISFCWNSVGFGKKHGFEIVEIMLVSHGGSKNDTIVTVERKLQSTLFQGDSQ
jgi:hypothetical protein